MKLLPDLMPSGGAVVDALFVNASFRTYSCAFWVFTLPLTFYILLSRRWKLFQSVIQIQTTAIGIKRIFLD